MNHAAATPRGFRPYLAALAAIPALAAAFALSGCAAATPPFRTARGAVDPRSIAEETRLPVNGTRQYLLVRGRDARDPVVLFVHGGPGGSETALMRLFHPALEERAVMAYWDQRGAGKSYASDLPPASMTIAQMLADLDVVVDDLRHRLGRERVVLLAHSWGTALGTLYAHQHPDKVAAYIGTGQVASNPEDERLAYEWALAEARRRDRADAVAELERIGPPPYELERLVVRDRWLDEFGGYFHTPISKWGVVWHALGTPEAGVADLWRLWRGTAFSQRHLWPEFARLDLTREVPALGVPVTFILGRHDRRTSSDLAARYLDALQAPFKRLVWLERSAHNAPFEEPEAFRAAVLDAIGAGR